MNLRMRSSYHPSTNQNIVSLMISSITQGNSKNFFKVHLKTAKHKPKLTGERCVPMFLSTMPTCHMYNKEILCALASGPYWS